MRARLTSWMSTSSARISCSSRSNGPSYVRSDSSAATSTPMTHATLLAPLPGPADPHPSVRGRVRGAPPSGDQTLRGARTTRSGSVRAVTRVLSCIQPTGDVHLGNYLGALRDWVASQHEHDAFHGIVDLHALTVTEEPGVVGAATARAGRHALRRRPRSRRGHRLRAEPRARALPARLDHGVQRVLRRAVAHGPVQGQVGQARGRVHLGRAVHLPGPAGGRHPPLRRRRGPRRRRPAPARRDHPRHRRALQRPLRRDVRDPPRRHADGRGPGDGPAGPARRRCRSRPTPAPG